MAKTEPCVKHGRIPHFWMAPDDCRRLCELLGDGPEPDGCHVRITVGGSKGMPELSLECVGHCDTPGPGPDPTAECCLECRHDNEHEMIIDCVCRD